MYASWRSLVLGDWHRRRRHNMITGTRRGRVSLAVTFSLSFLWFNYTLIVHHSIKTTPLISRCDVQGGCGRGWPETSCCAMRVCGRPAPLLIWLPFGHLVIKPQYRVTSAGVIAFCLLSHSLGSSHTFAGMGVCGRGDSIKLKLMPYLLNLTGCLFLVSVVWIDSLFSFQMVALVELYPFIPWFNYVCHCIINYLASI